ncbi:HalOD1 output domain-containing protein [Halorussus halobius]|uniref:HalOD1 output domain-containing protein n=1 Tax=Halorussus halobius TaxID=1710537 RepID=UPI00109269B4|nr:HalOD1 output domain-containing protein [Halorussus halobius]
MRNNGRTGNDDDPTLNEETHWRQAAQRLYEPEQDDELTNAVVFTIAEAESVEPSEVGAPPLYEVVDVTGIEAAFFGSGNGKAFRQGTGSVEFRYTEYLVKVRSDGWVQVYEPAETESS